MSKNIFLLPEIIVILSGVEGFYTKRASTKFVLSEAEWTQPDNRIKESLKDLKERITRFKKNIK